MIRVESKTDVAVVSNNSHKGNLERVLLFLIVVQVIFYLFSLFGRMPDIDDAWIGEHAYWLAKIGHAKSELMLGWQHQEERILIHHKLMTLIGYPVIKTFGFSLYALKSVSLVFFIVFLYSFYYFTRKKNTLLTKDQFLLSLFILFLFHYTFKFSFIFRPEVIIMFLTFISYNMLAKVINYTNSVPAGSKWLYLFIAGILSGLCGVAHLNGLSVVLAGSILIIVNKRFSFLPLFLFGGLVGFSVYFYDFTGEYGFAFWKQQLFQSVLGKNGGTTDVIGYMANSFLKEHMRFFHDLSIIGFSLLLIVSLMSGLRHLLSKHRLMLQYTLILWIIVAFLFTQKSRQYVLIYLPFLIIIISTVLDMAIKGTPGLRHWIYKGSGRILLFLTVILFAVGSTIFNIKISDEKFKADQNRQLVLNHIGHDVSGLKIVAPMEFIFNEILYFESIQGERLYTTLMQNDSTVYGEGFFKKAASFNRDYILLSGIYKRNLGLSGLDTGKVYSGYKFKGEYNGLTLYKRQELTSLP